MKNVMSRQLGLDQHDTRAILFPDYFTNDQPTAIWMTMQCQTYVSEVLSKLKPSDPNFALSASSSA